MKFIPKFNGYLYEIIYEYAGKSYLVRMVGENETQIRKRLEMKYIWTLRVESITCLKVV